MENLATNKQINFIKKLDPSFTEFEGLEKAKASRIIGHLLKVQKEAGATIAESKAAKAPAMKEKNVFKSIRLIENDLEKAQIIARTYDDNCYLEWFTNKNDYMHKYIIGEIKDHYTFTTCDNLEIDVELKKPSICSDIWYNDETEAPELNFENFKNYNFSQLNGKILEGNETISIIKCINKYNNNTEYYSLIAKRRTYDLLNNQTYVRDLTPEETQDMQGIYEKYKNDFIKRLATYWKKYKSKIYVRGYWANR